MTGLGGFVKAMHCKELTTTIPSLSLSLSLSLALSRSLPRRSRVATLRLALRLFSSRSRHVSLFLSLSGFPLAPSIFLFLILRLLVRSLSLDHYLSLFSSLYLSVYLCRPPLPLSLPSYLFLFLPPSRSRRARWGALATCTSLVNNSSRFSIRGISYSRVRDPSLFQRRFL